MYQENQKSVIFRCRPGHYYYYTHNTHTHPYTHKIAKVLLSYLRVGTDTSATKHRYSGIDVGTTIQSSTIGTKVAPGIDSRCM